MYADRTMLSGSRPFSLGAALLVNGGVVAGLLYFLAPNILPRPTINPLPATNYELPKDPPPIEKTRPKPQIEQPRIEQLYVPPQQIVTEPQHFDTTTTLPPYTPPTIPGNGTGERVAEPPKPVPPLIRAERDPRFARDFQPQYPGPELRLQREGTATVRVHIGSDGRVTEVQQVKATSPGFFEATRRQALAKWRFRPASRGGVAEDSWQTLTVTFVLTGE